MNPLDQVLENMMTKIKLTLLTVIAKSYILMTPISFRSDQ